MIDEADLHLHPSWQRHFIKQLPIVFPNVQFIVTTHSPQMLSEVESKSIRLLSKNKEGKIEIHTPEYSIGLSSSQILTLLMDSEETNQEMKDRLQNLEIEIENGNLDYVNQEIENIRAEYGDLPELHGLETLINLF
jgi:predicted ATP-binding protein involved in virulence